MVPKGLWVRIPSIIQNSAYGIRLKTRSEDRVLTRAISELYTKVKNVNEKVAGMKVTLKQTDQSEEK